MKSTLSIISFWILFITAILSMISNLKMKQERMEERFETNEVYVICNVIECYDIETDDSGYTVLVCEMPNGELHKYYIDDAPEGDVTIACLKTENQDDYTSYEVVAITDL